jgi:predicted glycoside hydrolase/deacetylase ChbG (UPF0249 family)
VTRIFVVNADDFGQSPSVNRGVVAAHDRGIVTSATVLAGRPHAKEAAAVAMDRPHLSVGLHVDLGEWVYRDEEWRQSHHVVDPTDAEAVSAEVERQLERFRELFGRDPTHIDSHQHVHREDPARSAVTALGRKLGVPVRHFAVGITYRGDFYGQSGKGHPMPEAITVDALISLIRGLPEGVTEIGCHPADGTDGLSMYDAEREVELRALCDPRVRATVEDEGILLRSFGSLDTRRLQ